MQYKVLKIEEDMDFGCEERQPGEALMSVVLMEDENGNETSLRHDDGLLYERDINEGDLVTMDGQHQLWKLKNRKGRTSLDFVMTALFVVMFIDQWEDAQDHKPALVGIVCSVICLVIFGSGKFILPLMASIVLCFLGMKKHEEKRKKERIQKSGEYQA